MQQREVFRYVSRRCPNLSFIDPKGPSQSQTSPPRICLLPGYRIFSAFSNQVMTWRRCASPHISQAFVGRILTSAEARTSLRYSAAIRHTCLVSWIIAFTTARVQAFQKSLLFLIMLHNNITDQISITHPKLGPTAEGPMIVDPSRLGGETLHECSPPCHG